MPYYRKLVDINEIDYNDCYYVTLFKCMWVNTTTSRGIMTNDLGFTLTNFTRLRHASDNDNEKPYIQAT